MRSHYKILALSALLTPGCDFLELEDEVYEDTGDTAEDSGEDSAEPEPEGQAYVRFINAVDGQALDFSMAFTENDAFALDSDTLYFTQGTGYADIGAGEWTLTLSGGDQAADEVLSLEDGKHYTVAALRDPRQQDGFAQAVLLEDNVSSASPVADSHTRVHWVHGMALDGTYAGQVYTHWGSADSTWYSAGPTSGTLFLDPHEGISWEYPFVDAPTYIFGQWGVPTELPQIALEVDAFIQAGDGELVNVYLTCTGDCDPEDSFVLGQFEDGSTATTEGCQVYATVNGQLQISDCP